MAGAGAPGLAGASGGDATAGGDRLRDTAGAVPEAGSGTPAAGFIVRESFSVPLRFPNTTTLHTGSLFCPQLPDQGRQERTPWLFGFAAACQPLSDLQKHLGGAVIGGELRDHLAVIGRQAEDLGIERSEERRVG